MFRKLAAECFGTFWLVFGGCGSAVLAAGFPELGIGFAGVALAFGLTVLTMAFAVGHISGGHFNPAVTIGLWAGGRFPAKEVVGYVIAQVVGGIVAAALLYLIASGKTGFDAAASGFASNGYGEHSPGGYSMLSALVVELVLSAGFLLVIHGATDKFAPAGFAPIAIGLALTLIHLISIPVTNTSVNPARSTAVAIFQGGWALEQLWFFWVVPIVGGIIGGLIYTAANLSVIKPEAQIYSIAVKLLISSLPAFILAIPVGIFTAKNMDEVVSLRMLYVNSNVDMFEMTLKYTLNRFMTAFIYLVWAGLWVAVYLTVKQGL